MNTHYGKNGFNKNVKPDHSVRLNQLCFMMIHCINRDKPKRLDPLDKDFKPLVDQTFLSNYTEIRILLSHYNWVFEIGGWDLLDEAFNKDRTLFGAAYYNAALKLNKGRDNAAIPLEVSVFEELSILLQKMEALGFFIKPLIMTRYMDHTYFSKRRKKR